MWAPGVLVRSCPSYSPGSLVSSSRLTNDVLWHKSLTLISAHCALSALEVSRLLTATHPFIVCQVLDRRALYAKMRDLSTQVVADVLQEVFNLTKGWSDGEDNAQGHATYSGQPQLHLGDRCSAKDGRDYLRLWHPWSRASLPVLPPPPFSTTINLCTFDLSKISIFHTALTRKLDVFLTELQCAYLGVELRDVIRQEGTGHRYARR
jgi:phenylalanine ammonia-lyase